MSRITSNSVMIRNCARQTIAFGAIVLALMLPNLNAYAGLGDVLREFAEMERERQAQEEERRRLEAEAALLAAEAAAIEEEKDRRMLTQQQIVDMLSVSTITLQSSNNDYLYMGNSLGESQDIFDGLSYFESKLKKENFGSFPNKQWVPILTGGITFFVPTVGELPKKVGTPYVERGLVKSQLNKLIGRSWIGGYETPEEQISSLYSNGVKLSEQWNLSYGEPLKKEQSWTIPYDVIWPEIRVISGQQVLLPVVYLSQPTHNAQQVDGNLLAFDSANLNYDSIYVDGAKIEGKRETLIELSGSFINSEGEVIAGSLDINAGSSIENLSGIMSADSIDLIASRIQNSTLVIKYDYGYGYTESAKNVGIITSAGDITATSSGDVVVQGAEISAQGDVTIQAGGNVEVIAQPVSEYRSEEGSYWSDSSYSVEQITSQLTGNDIAIMAMGAIELEGASISASGSIDLLAGMGIYLFEAINQNNFSRTFDISSGGVFGNEVSISEESQKSEAIRTLLNAGKDIALHAYMGDVVLRGTYLQANTQLVIVADDGWIDFALAKDYDFYSYQESEEDSFTFHNLGRGHIVESAIYNELIANGAIVLDAYKGVRIEYVNNKGLNESITELSKAPALAWMADVIERDDVNWIEVELAAEEWDYEAQGLTGAGAALVSIAVAAATGGAGAALVGELATQYVVTTAVLDAAISTLASQAAVSLAGNGFDVSATLHDLGSKESVRSLVQSMVTAGVMAGLDSKVFGDSEYSSINNPESAFSLPTSEQVLQAAAHWTVQSGIETVANGGNFEDFEDAFFNAMATDVVNKLGDRLATDIGMAPDLSTAKQYIAHAALGCFSQAAIAELDDVPAESACYSGAAGAVVGEYMMQQKMADLNAELHSFVNDMTDDSKDFTDKELMEFAFKFKESGVDVTRLSAAFMAYMLGGSVDAAASAAERAARFNASANDKLVRMVGVFTKGLNVWKWKDENDEIHYSDKCPTNVSCYGAAGESLLELDPEYVERVNAKLKLQMDCYYYEMESACDQINTSWVSQGDPIEDEVEEALGYGSPGQEQLKQMLILAKESGQVLSDIACDVNIVCSVQMIATGLDANGEPISQTEALWAMVPFGVAAANGVKKLGVTLWAYLPKAEKRLNAATGEFVDQNLELFYQAYLYRNSTKSKRTREDWYEQIEYIFKNTGIPRGNNFDRLANEWYDFNQVRIFAPSGRSEDFLYLDSYVPGEEIISRKAIDLDVLSDSQLRAYLAEFRSKYPVGAKIASVKYEDFFQDVSYLSGGYVLEIPESNRALPDIQRYIDIASEYGATIRFRPEK